jgi:hypothetical protein
MKKLTGLIVGMLAAIGAAVTVVFFLRKKQGSGDAPWSSAEDTATSWGETAGDQTGKAADKITGMADDAGDAASHAADQVKSQLGGER